MLSRLFDPLLLGLVLGIVPLTWLTRASWKQSAKAQRIALVAAWCGVASLWLMSSPWMASLCLRRLQPPPVNLGQALHAPADERALVVLSGGSRNVYSWVPDAETLDGVTQGRLIGAARAYREHGFRWVVVTGIHQEYVDGMADLLVELGVPRDRILFDPDAHSTRDNAKNSKRILDGHPEVKQV
ncbi:MAG: YdcF family protein, partial [Polyangiaceae bacterium]|nr:YdcF family protein [Polyangiaceae bacterium]